MFCACELRPRVMLTRCTKRTHLESTWNLCQAQGVLGARGQVELLGNGSSRHSLRCIDHGKTHIKPERCGHGHTGGGCPRGMRSRTTCRGRALHALRGWWMERTKKKSGCCRGLAHPRKPSGSAMLCLTCRSGKGADIVWLAGVFNVDIRSIQGTMININLCVLTVVSERRCHTDIGREGPTNKNGLCTPR